MTDFAPVKLSKHVKIGGKSSITPSLSAIGMILPGNVLTLK
jgi:hypothetical protein